MIRDFFDALKAAAANGDRLPKPAVSGNGETVLRELRELTRIFKPRMDTDFLTAKTQREEFICRKEGREHKEETF